MLTHERRNVFATIGFYTAEIFLDKARLLLNSLLSVWFDTVNLGLCNSYIDEESHSSQMVLLRKREKQSGPKLQAVEEIQYKNIVGWHVLPFALGIDQGSLCGLLFYFCYKLGFHWWKYHSVIFTEAVSIKYQYLRLFSNTKRMWVLSRTKGSDPQEVSSCNILQWSYS